MSNIIASYTGSPEEINFYLNGRIYVNPVRWGADRLGNPLRKLTGENWVEYHERIERMNALALEQGKRHD